MWAVFEETRKEGKAEGILEGRAVDSLLQEKRFPAAVFYGKLFKHIFLQFQAFHLCGLKSKNHTSNDPV